MNVYYVGRRNFLVEHSDSSVLKNESKLSTYRSHVESCFYDFYRNLHNISL